MVLAMPVFMAETPKRRFVAHKIAQTGSQSHWGLPELL
jgi:hypothetical protein